MLSYLLDRDHEHNFRFSTRKLTDAYGVERSYCNFRLIWRWFDHLVAYEFGPTVPEILHTATQIAQRQTLPLDAGLALAVATHVRTLEHLGGDVTDDNPELVARLRGALEALDRRFTAPPFGD